METIPRKLFHYENRNSVSDSNGHLFSELCRVFLAEVYQWFMGKEKNIPSDIHKYYV